MELQPTQLNPLCRVMPFLRTLHFSPLPGVDWSEVQSLPSMPVHVQLRCDKVLPVTSADMTALFILLSTHLQPLEELRLWLDHPYHAASGVSFTPLHALPNLNAIAPA